MTAHIAASHALLVGLAVQPPNTRGSANETGTAA